MKSIGFIYLTTNLVNGKIYIGRHEFNKHNKTYLGSGYRFKLALEKYGKENFKRKILRLCFTEHELSVWEYVYIKKYHSQDKNIGYNIADGDVNTSDYNPAKLPEVRKKMSISAKKRLANPKNHNMYGKHHSEESKRKMSSSQKKRFLNSNSPFKGKHHTEESKRKMSESRKRVVFTEEYRKHLSEAQKRRFTNSIHPMYGRIWINNGIIEKFILKEDVIPDGFVVGRLLKNRI